MAYKKTVSFFCFIVFLTGIIDARKINLKEESQDVVSLVEPSVCRVRSENYNISDVSESGVYKKKIRKNKKIEHDKKEVRVQSIVLTSEAADEEAPPPVFSLKKSDTRFVLSGKYKPEMMYGKNLALLNASNKSDQILPVKHTFDLGGLAQFGCERYGYNAAEFKFGIRTKGVFGNPSTIIPTNAVKVKSVDAKIGEHRHSLGYHVLWVRELSLKTSLNSLFDSSYEKQHHVKIGFHPFTLGHGIVLGPAFALTPGFLGFYTDSIVDQFTPGILFTGDILKDSLAYDVYGAIFENKSDSISNTTEEIYKKASGRQGYPARGFGSFNWLAAARLLGTRELKNNGGTVTIEPYILYNRAPEQKIEFIADAESKLGTVGLQLTHAKGDYEFSCEFAKNFGKQNIHGWDRDAIVQQINTTTGSLEHVHSHVVTAAGGTVKAPDTPTNNSSISAQTVDCSTSLNSYNGQTVTGTTLVNTADRFRPCLNHSFKGWMFVSDIGYWILDKQVQLAGAFGIASGDNDPSLSLFDSVGTGTTPDFNGFIGLQEVFNGSRVESVYVLGQRKLARPLTLPNSAIKNGHHASTVSSFSNIIYAGGGLHVEPHALSDSKFSWRPNILVFWQEEPTQAFDIATATTSKTKLANSFLGIEVNSFIDFNLLDTAKFYFVGSVFFPGSHYDDVRGMPLNSAHLKLLDRDDVDIDTLPLLSNDSAVSFTMGIEYSF